MNLRCVVEAFQVRSLAVPPRRLTLVRHPVGPRFQPRDASGRFVTYAQLRDAIEYGYTITWIQHPGEDGAETGPVWVDGCAGCELCAFPEHGDGNLGD